MKEVFFSICSKNSSIFCFKYANYISKKSGGESAVAEVCIFILKKFFKINV